MKLILSPLIARKIHGIDNIDHPNIGKIPQYQQILLLKIDTEGHVYFVLKGSAQLLDAKRVTFIIFEVQMHC